MRIHLGWRLRLFLWWLAIGVAGAIVAAPLIDVAYSRFVYYFVVMPIGGVLLFPVAYAANRWLTPLARLWPRRS
ncbi:MAG: hypothetical protein E6I73_03035 [Chloroflexi bacterium]|nr:MAG: hypothetical protein E6I73_03035 [Chloroflexota bacterium]